MGSIGNDYLPLASKEFIEPSYRFKIVKSDVPNAVSENFVLDLGLFGKFCSL